MIWVAGRIVPDESLTISALDRTFEHGLGLFETFRTWNGHPTLLDRHLARMKRSAGELGIPVDPAACPTAGDVTQLVRASGFETDARLRITLSGGLSETGDSVVWMRAAPLPPATRGPGANVAFGLWTLPFHGDPLIRYKSLNYWSRRHIYEWATGSGFDEILSKTEQNLPPVVNVWEGSRTNLFLVRGGVVITPPLEGPIVPGVMRALVLEHAQRLSLQVVANRPVTDQELFQANEVFLTNSVRGIIPVQRVERMIYESPGSLTRCLMVHLSDWLGRGGADE